MAVHLQLHAERERSFLIAKYYCDRVSEERRKWHKGIKASSIDYIWRSKNDVLEIIFPFLPRHLPLGLFPLLHPADAWKDVITKYHIKCQFPAKHSKSFCGGKGKWKKKRRKAERKEEIWICVNIYAHTQKVNVMVRLRNVYFLLRYL